MKNQHKKILACILILIAVCGFVFAPVKPISEDASTFYIFGYYVGYYAGQIITMIAGLTLLRKSINSTVKEIN